MINLRSQIVTSLSGDSGTIPVQSDHPQYESIESVLAKQGWEMKQSIQIADSKSIHLFKKAPEKKPAVPSTPLFTKPQNPKATPRPKMARKPFVSPLISAKKTAAPVISQERKEWLKKVNDINDQVRIFKLVLTYREKVESQDLVGHPDLLFSGREGKGG